jgi:methylmalonyl-CoA decarboxylase subunit alpha
LFEKIGLGSGADVLPTFWFSGRFDPTFCRKFNLPETAMASVEERIKDLSIRIEKEKAGGGPARIEKQHAAGKLTARERLDKLFDPGSFVETDMFVRHRCTNFGMEKKVIPGEGVVTGWGKVNGRTVFAYAQDFTAQGGTLGEMHARKITKVMDMALKAGCPLIGFNDSGGARIQEGVDALAGYGEIFFRNSAASGVIPQLSAIMGPCAGGAVYSPAMTDFIFMVKNTSYMFITGPKVIEQVTGEKIDFEGLGGAMVHNQISGNAHFAAEDDADCIEQIKALLSFLPQNNVEDPPYQATSDPVDRLAPELDTLIPDQLSTSYDMYQVISAIVDDGYYFESQALFAGNLITAFARLGGHPVGIIANQPAVKSGCLDVDSADKATRFIRFCDAFNIQLLTLADVPGYLPGVDQEHAGIIRHGAKLLWCYSEATVPKVTLATRKDYGGAFLAMCARQLGADFMAAWPTGEIAVMGAEGAAPIIHGKEIRAAEDPKAETKARVEQYRDLFYNPYTAAARAYIDAVIKPSETRSVLIKAFDAMRSKREVRPPKKHGNIPV